MSLIFFDLKLATWFARLLSFANLFLGAVGVGGGWDAPEFDNLLLVNLKRPLDIFSFCYCRYFFCFLGTAIFITCIGVGLLTNTKSGVQRK